MNQYHKTDLIIQFEERPMRNSFKINVHNCGKRPCPKLNFTGLIYFQCLHLRVQEENTDS